MIISVVAAKIWYLKNVRFLLGHPVQYRLHNKVSTFMAILQRSLALKRQPASIKFSSVDNSLDEIRETADTMSSYVVPSRFLLCQQHVGFCLRQKVSE